MKYVLSGVETNNKGAELMLYAILQEIERRDPDAIVYMTYLSQGVGYVKTNVDLRIKPLGRLINFLRNAKISNHSLLGILGRLGFGRFFIDVYSVGKIDYFLDASGFCVSDKWNTADYEVKNWTRLLSTSKKDGAKIIFLPQGFGPIEQENNKKLLKAFNDYGNLIIAREKTSYDYIKNTGIADMNKVKMFTDFTSLVHCDVPSGYDHLRNAVCIIPNERMIDMGAISYDRYIELLKQIANVAKDKGSKVYLLNHEGEGDERLALACKESMGDDIEVVTKLNGLDVKGLISTAKLVVTSRFHGVASSLNSCVPCLATSWSHKYSELFKDYGLDNCVLPLDDNEQALLKVSEFLDEKKNDEIRKILVEKLPKIQQETRNMWKEVWSV